MMPEAGLWEAAYPFSDDVLTLPVADLDQAVRWYGEAFGLSEVDRPEGATPSVILQRDGVRVGFAINGRNPAAEGAAILVNDIHRAKQELETNGVNTVNWRVDERDGEKFQVFFVVAPDGLCFYYHQPIAHQPIAAEE